MKIIRGEFKEKLDLLFAPSIKAGFPNSADDYMHESLATIWVHFAVRPKGNRRYVTVGAGFALSIVRLDVSYCIATASTNPLNNTMRFTLGFDLAGIKDLVNNKK